MGVSWWCVYDDWDPLPCMKWVAPAQFLCCFPLGISVTTCQDGQYPLVMAEIKGPTAASWKSASSLAPRLSSVDGRGWGGPRYEARHASCDLIDPLDAKWVTHFCRHARWISIESVHFSVCLLLWSLWIELTCLAIQVATTKKLQ